MGDTGEGGNAASEAQKDARAVAGYSPSMTIGEAEAWRAGWRAARDAIVAEVRPSSGASMALGLYATMQTTADLIADMEPPA